MPYQSLFPLTIIMGCVSATGLGLGLINWLGTGKYMQKPDASRFDRLLELREQTVKAIEKKKNK